MDKINALSRFRIRGHLQSLFETGTLLTLFTQVVSGADENVCHGFAVTKKPDCLRR